MPFEAAEDLSTTKDDDGVFIDKNEDDGGSEPIKVDFSAGKKIDPDAETGDAATKDDEPVSAPVSQTPVEDAAKTVVAPQEEQEALPPSPQDQQPPEEPVDEQPPLPPPPSPQDQQPPEEPVDEPLPELPPPTGPDLNIDTEDVADVEPEGDDGNGLLWGLGIAGLLGLGIWAATRK